MRVLTIDEAAATPAGLLPALVAAAKCVGGADGAIAAYGAQALVSNGSTSACGAIVSGIGGCVGGFGGPVGAAVAGIGVSTAAAMCDRPSDNPSPSAVPPTPGATWSDSHGGYWDTGSMCMF